jgi:hypothetical protein
MNTVDRLVQPEPTSSATRDLLVTARHAGMEKLIDYET